jgi:vesicular inhibitory amino acid transporter
VRLIAQLFNSIAILLGIGMLSEPLAFAYAGWIGGTALLVFMGFLNCYTSVELALFNYVLPLTTYNSAKILARIILEDSRLRSYADIGRKAFGPKSTGLTTIMFCLELSAVRSACFLNEAWSHFFDVSLALLSSLWPLTPCTKSYQHIPQIRLKSRPLSCKCCFLMLPTQFS